MIIIAKEMDRLYLWIPAILFVSSQYHYCHAYQEPSVSQISPKSTVNEQLEKQQIYNFVSSTIHYLPVDIQSSYNNDITTINDYRQHHHNNGKRFISSSSGSYGESDEDKLNDNHVQHAHRTERSASPILNHPNDEEIASIPNLSPIDVNQIDQFDHLDGSGRYFSTIDPTSSLDKEPERLEDLILHRSNYRMAKVLSGTDFFLERGGLRSIASESPITPTNTVLLQNSPSTVSITNHARQNPNPDIQDIITGIVKLLNGNVNVHANTQLTSRRPYTTRINNRGPPRISDIQPILNDYEQAQQLTPTSTMRPPPYPFDRPDAPIRPFLNGVPLPEQIVPSMQQTYRPGFISQNRPPWQRPRPRPPIMGNRRPPPPLPAYKPMRKPPVMSPPPVDYQPEEYLDIPSVESTEINDTESTDDNSSIDDDDLLPEEITASKIELDDTKSSTSPSHNQLNKDSYTKKKEKNKISEKKPIIPVTQTTSFKSDTPILEPSMTTIIQSTSEVNVQQYLANTGTPDHVDEVIISILDSSINDPVLPIDSSSGSISNIATPTLTSTVNTLSSISSSSTVPLASTQLINNNISTIASSTSTSAISTPNLDYPYHPRPGIVLDDPEFKPGIHNRLPHRPTIAHPHSATPPGYGEIFDVTLSAIQGPSGSGSQQTINIQPYGSDNHFGGNSDIIISPSGDNGFVSIDGKRTYINLFGESTDPPKNILPISTANSISTEPSQSIKPTQTIPGILGTGYAVVETETPQLIKSQSGSGILNRPIYRPRLPPQQPPVRIDTCIVGDDSTCDMAQNEKCKTDYGVSSCHCRPGYARSKHREPCRKVVSLLMSLRVDKIYERRIIWDKLLADQNSEPYGQLSYEAIRAIDSAMSMTPFSDEFLVAKVNRIYKGDASQGAAGVFVNLTVELEENGETLRPNVKNDIQKHLLGVIHRRNNNIGNSALFVESPPGSISNLQDLDECTSGELNDCHTEAQCTNVWGSFRCECNPGYRDPWSDQSNRAGRDCQSCADAYCNNRGTCTYNNGQQLCGCISGYYGGQCEIDGEVLGVAIGASVAAVIIIVLTLVCLVMWSRRWQREQKHAMGSPIFVGTQVKTPGIGQAPYQVTLEDRMRWAQIADVMAQSNHYGVDPVGGGGGSTRPSSARFVYPSLQMLNQIGTISMAGTLPLHPVPSAPVAMPRYGLSLHSRSNGMRTLENSSSSEDGDRTDLLEHNFQVPRPKSRSNGSIANQFTESIYYDVDYEPSGGELLYGGTQTTSVSNNLIPGPQGIPMSTYSAGRAPSLYYKK